MTATARPLPLVLLALSLLATPLTSAHGDAAEGAYDPLMLDLHAFLQVDATLVEQNPRVDSIAWPIPAQPGQPNPSLDFAIPAPQPMVTQRGLVATLVVHAGTAGPAQDQRGDSFEVTLLRNGEPIDGASARGSFGPLMVAGQTSNVSVAIAAPPTDFVAGDSMGIRVRPLMPLLREGDIILQLGPEGSRVDFDALRVPHVRDLGLATEGQTVFRLGEETFRPSLPNAAVITATVTHDGITFDRTNVTAGEPLYIVFVADEPHDVAEAAHERFDAEARRSAAHTYLVGGGVVHVHPGVGIAVRVDYTEHANRRVTCFANCEEDAPMELRVEPPPPTRPDQRGALIPPPREQVTLPPDERETNDADARTPLALPAVLAGLTVAALTARPLTLTKTPKRQDTTTTKCGQPSPSLASWRLGVVARVRGREAAPDERLLLPRRHR